MKALIYKDLLVVKKQVLLMLLILAAILSILAVQGQYLALPVGIMLISFMIPLMSFGYDEQCRFEKFAFAGPITRTEFVLSKYVPALVLALIGGVSTFATLVLSQKQTVDGAILFSVLATALPLIMISVLFPMVFKLGVERARFVVIVAYATIFAFISAAKTVLERSSGLFEKLKDFSLPLATLICTAVIILVCVASMIISDRIVKQKEY